jgi:hypothetical protein
MAGPIYMWGTIMSLPISMRKSWYQREARSNIVSARGRKTEQLQELLKCNECSIGKHPVFVQDIWPLQSRVRLPFAWSKNFVAVLAQTGRGAMVVPRWRHRETDRRLGCPDRPFGWVINLLKETGRGKMRVVWQIR